MADSEARAREVFGLEEWAELPDVTEESLETYWEHLLSHLTFPFDAAYEEEEEPDSIGVQVTGLISVEESPDDPEMYGLFCEVTRGSEIITIPLAVIEVVDENSENYELVEDYKDWFWNYR